MWYYRSPTIVFGEDSLAFLNSVKSRRCLIVSDRNLEKAGIVDNIKELLPEDCRTMIFSSIDQEPTFSQMTSAMDSIMKFKPDHIVAVGGGSVIDTAKVILFRYARPDLDFYDLTPLEYLGIKEAAKLIAIPTTSGTGSECSWAAVVSDEREKRKNELASSEILPDYAILDPAVVTGLPRKQTVSTAVDAMTHAIEAYVSTWRNFYSDALAEKALELITGNIAEVLHDPGDIQARNSVHIGASMAGSSFSNSQIGLAHALGHALGAIFKVPHGTSVGLFLPAVVEFNSTVVHDRYDRLNSIFPESMRDKTLAGSLRKIFATMGQPVHISDAGISKDSYNAAKPSLEKLAMESTGLVANPRESESADIHMLLEEVMG